MGYIPATWRVFGRAGYVPPRAPKSQVMRSKPQESDLSETHTIHDSVAGGEIQEPDPCRFCTLPLEIRFRIFDLIFIRAPAEDPRFAEAPGHDKPRSEERIHIDWSGDRRALDYPYTKCFIFGVNKQLYHEFMAYVQSKGSRNPVIETNNGSFTRLQQLKWLHKRLGYPAIAAVKLRIVAMSGFADKEIMNWVITMVWLLKKIPNLRLSKLQVEIDTCGHTMLFLQTPRGYDCEYEGACEMLIDIQTCELQNSSGSLDFIVKRRIEGVLYALKHASCRMPGKDSSFYRHRIFLA